MRYWIIKGNPRQNDWDSMLVPGQINLWHSGRTPKSWAIGDRIFCWESSPASRIIGLAELHDTDAGVDDNGDGLFRIRYLTKRFRFMPNIHELREIPELLSASFLKTGPASTLFPLTESQAVVLFRVLAEGNPFVESVWPDIIQSDSTTHIPDLDSLFGLSEGGQHLASHLRRERSQILVAAKKRQVLTDTDNLACEVCGFDFSLAFGDIGEGFCEVHHIKPLSDSEGSTFTALTDLAVLCSNCHRIIHRLEPMLSVKQLSTIRCART